MESAFKATGTPAALWRAMRTRPKEPVPRMGPRSKASRPAEVSRRVVEEEGVVVVVVEVEAAGSAWGEKKIE